MPTPRLRRFVLVLAIASAPFLPVGAVEIVHVYGPGGPLPAVKQPAEAFGRSHGAQVIVAGGPTPKQNGLWKDVAGRPGSIETVAAFRHNVVVYAGNSAEVRNAWTADKSLDAWLICDLCSLGLAG